MRVMYGYKVDSEGEKENGIFGACEEQIFV